MKGRSVSNLKLMWLMVSSLCLVLPVFLPSTPYPQDFSENPLGTATITMFVLSFPSSLFALPAMLFVNISFGFGSDSVAGMYLNLLVLFALGYVQWFWIVPRFFRRNTRDLEVLNLNSAPAQLGEARMSPDFSFFDSDARTPLERVINEWEEK
jgi:hypothetical protein